MLPASSTALAEILAERDRHIGDCAKIKRPWGGTEGPTLEVLKRPSRTGFGEDSNCVTSRFLLGWLGEGGTTDWYRKYQRKMRSAWKNSVWNAHVTWGSEHCGTYLCVTGLRLELWSCFHAILRCIRLYLFALRTIFEVIPLLPTLKKKRAF